MTPGVSENKHAILLSVLSSFEAADIFTNFPDFVKIVDIARVSCTKQHALHTWRRNRRSRKRKNTGSSQSGHIWDD